MENQKRFQKKALNNNDHSGMERGAKVLKRAAGAAGLAAIVIKNKDTLKKLGGQAANIVRNIVKL